MFVELTNLGIFASSQVVIGYLWNLLLLLLIVHIIE